MNNFNLAMDEILNRIFPEDLPDRESQRKILGARWGIDGQRRRGYKELDIPNNQITRHIREAEQALIGFNLHTRFAELVIETTSELAKSDLKPLLDLATRDTTHAEMAGLRQELEPRFNRRLGERGFVLQGSRWILGKTNG
jgi:hypothetical protein